MPKLEKRMATLQGRPEQLSAREQRVETRRRSITTRRARNADLRRKVLVGSIVLARVEQGLLARQEELNGWLERGLTRPEDRALLGLESR